MNTTQPTTTFSSASIYVGDLKPEVTESQLYELFKTVGPISTIRVCRDSITRRSLGYAYINFMNFSDADRAMDLYNYKEIKGKPCRIMWCQRDPSVRKSNVGNIFIKNLDKGIDNKMLYDTFSSFGEILSCKISTDENGKSKGYAFIHFASQASADEAIRKVNGNLMNDKQVFVGPFLSKKERSQDEPKWTNIYAKNLDKSITLEKLNEMFGVYGRITSSCIMMDENGESKGFAFINYETHEAADAAVLALHESEVEGKKLYVQRAQKKHERERVLKDLFTKMQLERVNKYQGVNLYVKNLHESVDDERLREEFSKFGGTITSTRVMRDEKTGVSKGFGFVCFSSPEEATKAVTEMNGVMIFDKPIYVGLAQKKDARRQQLMAAHAFRNGPRGVMAPAPYYQMPNRPMYYPPMNQGAYPMPGVMYPPKDQKGMRKVPFNGPVYPNIKFSATARNQQVAPPHPQQNGAPVVDNKMMIGEALYPLIGVALKALNEEPLTGKVTGMLLDALEESELMQLLQSPEDLNNKIAEARNVLKEFKPEEVSVA